MGSGWEERWEELMERTPVSPEQWWRNRLCTGRIAIHINTVCLTPRGPKRSKMSKAHKVPTNEWPVTVQVGAVQGMDTCCGQLRWLVALTSWDLSLWYRLLVPGLQPAPPESKRDNSSLHILCFLDCKIIHRLEGYMAGLFSTICMTTTWHQGTLIFSEMSKCCYNTDNNNKNNNNTMAPAPAHYTETNCNA